MLANVLPRQSALPANFWNVTACSCFEMSPMWSILWNGFHIMQIVQIVLDKKLLHAADQAAKRTKRNRSALVRDALREYLLRLELQAREERDRQGYSRHSQGDAEARGWESEASWPEE